MRDFGPDGALSYCSDLAVLAMKAGRSELFDQRPDLPRRRSATLPAARPPDLGFGLVPAGPAGRFPGVAVHGLGIPAGFAQQGCRLGIHQLGAVQGHHAQGAGRKGLQLAHPPDADIDSADYKQRMTLNGYDVAGTARSKSVELAARTGYMKYRTVHVYPQVDKQLDKAIELIASGQLSAREAMAKAQAGSIDDLKRAGVRV